MVCCTCIVRVQLYYVLQAAATLPNYVKVLVASHCTDVWFDGQALTWRLPPARRRTIRLHSKHKRRQAQRSHDWALRQQSMLLQRERDLHHLRFRSQRGSRALPDRRVGDLSEGGRERSAAIHRLPSRLRLGEGNSVHQGRAVQPMPSRPAANIQCASVSELPLAKRRALQLRAGEGAVLLRESWLPGRRAVHALLHRTSASVRFTRQLHLSDCLSLFFLVRCCCIISLIRTTTVRTT